MEVLKKTGTFESFDGTPVYYEVRGEGKPILMAYGIGCPMNHWIHQVRHFSKTHQTILFDYRGHHNTPTPENRDNLSLDAIAQDVKCLFDHLNIKKASMWGHSYGAQVLFRVFEMNPEIFANLVLINGFATNPIKNMFGTNFIEKYVFPYLQMAQQASPDFVGKIWKMGVTNPLAVPFSALAGGFNLSLTSMRDIEVYAKGVASMDLGVFLHLFDQMMKYDAQHVLEKVNVPTLIVSGNKDGVTPASYQDMMHEKIEGSEIQRVPYGSHCTQLDMPEFVNLRIEKFLKENRY
jgi:pimeloyl-ACP methyl ester carboxylesterase